jgi:hypothetical protein
MGVELRPAGTALAQSRYGIELNGGAAFPTRDLGAAALESGFGSGFIGTLRVLPHLHLYVGWDYQRFVTDERIGTNEYDIDDTGYTFGARFQHPLRKKVDVWVRAGGLYNHIEMEDSDGDIISDTGHEFGWEAGAGLSVPITSRIAIMPGARYRTYSSTLTVGHKDIDVDLSYVTAELRLAFKLGGPPVSALIR